MTRFAESGDDFDVIRDEAVRQHGIVVPGLRDKIVNDIRAVRHQFAGSSLGAHISALMKLPEIIAENVDAVIHPDYIKVAGDRGAGAIN